MDKIGCMCERGGCVSCLVCGVLVSILGWRPSEGMQWVEKQESGPRKGRATRTLRTPTAAPAHLLLLLLYAGLDSIGRLEALVAAQALLQQLEARLVQLRLGLAGATAAAAAT